MGTTRVTAGAKVPPERFISALTDFGPARFDLWANSRPGYFQLHDRGDTWADVTEGSPAGGGIWQRYRYDWSTPGVVRLQVLDGNTFGVGSSWEYRVVPEDGGRSRIELTVHRAPVSAKGRVLDALLTAFGGLYLGRDLRRTVRKLERA